MVRVTDSGREWAGVRQRYRADVASYLPGLAACWPNWQAIDAVPIAAAGSSTSMNTNRSPSIGPDPGVNRSGRVFLSVGVCPLAQFPSPRSAAMNTIIDATLRARAPRGALSVASTRSIGGFPGRFSTSGSEVWDEENISISFQLLHVTAQPTELERRAVPPRPSGTE